VWERERGRERWGTDRGERRRNGKDGDREEVRKGEIDWEKERLREVEREFLTSLWCTYALLIKI
jgi:hypothetical protein